MVAGAVSGSIAVIRVVCPWHDSPVYVVVEAAHCDACDISLDAFGDDLFPMEICALCLRQPGNAVHERCGNPARLSQGVPV